MINNKKIPSNLFMQVVHNVKRLICQLLIYIVDYTRVYVSWIYRKLVASIPFIIQLTELSRLHINP